MSYEVSSSSKEDIRVTNVFNVGVNPSSIAITHNGKYGYVTNSNNYGIEGSDSVTVLNLKTGLPKLTIHDASFNEPYRTAIDRHDKFAYVCNSGGTTVSVIRIKTNEVVGVIEGFDGPGSIVINKLYAYVTNYGSSFGVGSGNGKTVSMVNLKKRVIIDTIEVDLAPAALALSPNQGYLYVACYVNGLPGTGTLNIVSTDTNTIVHRVSGLFGPFGIALTKDGQYAYVTNFGSNDFAPYGTSVTIIDLYAYEIIQNIQVGIQPSGIAISDRYAYVSNYNTLYAKPAFQNLTPGEGTVNIIDLQTNEVVAPTISVGQSPSFVALAPNKKKLYVTKYVQNTVAEICL